MKARTNRFYRNIGFSLVLSLMFFLSPPVTFGKMLTYVKEYRYQASEADSKLTARLIAFEQVKRLLLEEVGAYVISETEVRDFDLTKDLILSFSAGVVSTAILDEDWDGHTYLLKARMSADTDALVKSIDQIRKNQDQKMTWEEVARETKGALSKIDTLKSEIGKGGGDKGAQEKYAQAVNELSAIEWFKKGYALRYVEYNNQEAMKAFEKATEIDPKYAKAYALKASIYNDWDQFYKGLGESEKALRLNPKLPWGYSSRAAAHIGLGNYPEGITDCNKAIELNPQSYGAYTNRSWAYYRMKNYRLGVEDGNKAIEINPGHSHAYLQRGRNLAALGKYESAVSDFSKSIELNPVHSWAFLSRGLAYMQLGKKDQALEDFKKAAQLGNAQAQTRLKSQGVQW